jgi:hypothetical protein
MIKITFTKASACFIALFFAFNFGFGQILTFDFIGATGAPVSFNSNYNDPDLTISTITRGIGLSNVNNNDRFNAQSWALTSIANAVSGNDYMEFTISPVSGNQFEITTIVFNVQRSATGLSAIALRSSIDVYTTNIDGIKNIVDATNSTEVITFTVNQVNSSSAVTYRIYGYSELTGGSGGFEGTGNDIIVNGSVSIAPPCSSTVTWDGFNWSPTAPSSSTEVIINGDYDSAPAINGSFSACSLTINPTYRLTVGNNSFVDIENDVIVDGELSVQTTGNFVQNDDLGTFTIGASGYAQVNKQTASKAKWYYYTYWSSPVVGQTIGNAFPNVDGDRRFWFNAANYLDQHTVGTTNGIPDDIDDNGDDWQYAYAGDVMQPGVGYASTEARFHFPNSAGSATFIGEFNNGDIDVAIYNNPLNTIGSWNLIGNPYPSAIDFNAFQTANSSVIDGTVYFWSQATPPSSANAGNQNLNFSKNDYAIYTAGSGGIKVDANGVMPNGFVPSGQSFFIAGLTNGTATFTNAMRVANGTSNSQFFKGTKTKKSTSITDNKLWVNLTSNNGVFNQILIAYVDGATNDDDGLFYDAPKLPSDAAATLYSKIEGSNKNFGIQGKDASSLNESEIINLGFKTTINVATTYTLSIEQLQGDFLNNTPVYLEDTLLNKIHDLSASDYSFTSAVGEFNSRFKIVFTNKTLSNTNVALNNNSLKIIDLDNDYVQFKTTNNLSITQVNIYDLLGRELYAFKGNNTTETYKFTNLKNSVYVAKVTLLNGTTITKKAFKR